MRYRFGIFRAIGLVLSLVSIALAIVLACEPLAFLYLGPNTATSTYYYLIDYLDSSGANYLYFIILLLASCAGPILASMCDSTAAKASGIGISIAAAGIDLYLFVSLLDDYGDGNTSFSLAAGTFVLVAEAAVLILLSLGAIAAIVKGQIDGPKDELEVKEADED